MHDLRYIPLAIAFGGGLLPTAAFAHGNAPKVEGTRVDAAVSVTVRSRAAVDEDAPWRIPGIMMGGEALPAEYGASLDNAGIGLTHRKAEWHAAIAINSHDNGHEIELEEAMAGFQREVSFATVTVDAGRMNGLFNPYAAEHANDRLFSEAPLAEQAFLGGHFNDTGVRAHVSLPAGLSAGVESWRGEAFPASDGSNGGATDFYLHGQWQIGALGLKAGTWGNLSDAYARQDERYNAGHSHGSSAIVLPDVWFDGEVWTQGLFVAADWRMTQTLTPFAVFEYMTQNVEGDVRDATRLAALDGDYEGLRLETGLRWRTHQLGIRMEQLVAENTISGAGASVLADSAGLNNPGEDPSRLSLGWRMALTPAISLRAEYVADATTPGEDGLADRDRVAAGIIWQETLWQR